MTEHTSTVRLVIAYDGSDFHGWQKQPSLPTVEGSLRSALAVLKNHPDPFTLEFQGASRTDAGVHASGQVASFPHIPGKTEWDYVRALNSLTPDSILVRSAEILEYPFNARFDSKGKRYEYRIWNQRYPEPLERHRSWTFGLPLDASKMQSAADLLVGEHDFSAFRAADCQSESTIRQIFSIEVHDEKPLIRIVVRGNAFMKNMVRIIAGTLVETGEGRMAAGQVLEALEKGNRRIAGRTAPAQGLCLMEVFYESPEEPH